MIRLVLFLHVISVYPYERVFFSPFEIGSEEQFLIEDFSNPTFFLGMVFYPAGLKSFSSGARFKNFNFNIGLISTGEVKSYDNFGEEMGYYTAGVLRASAGVKLPTDIVNISYSLSGIRAYGPEFNESRAWLNIDFYRNLFAFESLSMGLTLSYESSVSVYLFGPHHFVGGDFYSNNDYEVRSALYWSNKFAGFLFGFSYLSSRGEALFKPFFSFKVKHKNLGVYYFYRLEREMSDVMGISVCYE